MSQQTVELTGELLEYSIPFPQTTLSHIRESFPESELEYRIVNGQAGLAFFKNGNTNRPPDGWVYRTTNWGTLESGLTINRDLIHPGDMSFSHEFEEAQPTLPGFQIQ